MTKFKEWYVSNQDRITWFVIGMMTSMGIDQLIRGSYGLAIFSFAIAYLNYKLESVRLQ